MAIDARWTKEQLKLYTRHLEMLVQVYATHTAACRAMAHGSMCTCGYFDAMRKWHDLETGTNRPADDAPAIGSAPRP